MSSIKSNTNYYFPNIQAQPAEPMFPEGLCVGIPPQHNIELATLEQLAPKRTARSTTLSTASISISAQQKADKLAVPYYMWGHPGTLSGYLPMIHSKLEYGYNSELLHKVWLLINEPDRGGQANLTPYSARGEIRKALAAGIKNWIGPNVALTYENWGIAWLERYLQINAPIPTKWGIHIYPTPSIHTLDAFDRQYEKFYELITKYNAVRPIIITETDGGAGNPEHQVAYMHGIVERMEVYDEFEATFWFSAYYERTLANGQKHKFKSNLLDENKKRNYIGDAFMEIVDNVT